MISTNLDAISRNILFHVISTSSPMTRLPLLLWNVIISPCLIYLVDGVISANSDQSKPDFNNCIFSVDGGVLLSRVLFNKGMKFKKIAKLYVSYVTGQLILYLMDMEQQQRKLVSIEGGKKERRLKWLL